jgi:hypothetical protein
MQEGTRGQWSSCCGAAAGKPLPEEYLCWIIAMDVTAVSSSADIESHKMQIFPKE